MTKHEQPAPIGHNSETQINAETRTELKSFIERLERLDEEAAGLRGDVKEVYAELKGRGFDAKAVRHILKLRKQDHLERQEFEAIVDLYARALGMTNVFA